MLMSSSVLVIDDSLTVRMDLKTAFEAGGYACTVAATLDAGRVALNESLFNLIVLDVQLPDGNGVEFLAELKAAAETRAIPVILLSLEADVRAPCADSGRCRRICRQALRKGLSAQLRQRDGTRRQPDRRYSPSAPEPARDRSQRELSPVAQAARRIERIWTDRGREWRRGIATDGRNPTRCDPG